MSCVLGRGRGPGVVVGVEEMKCGSLLCFHGAFTSKRKAEQKEARTPGAFIKGAFIKNKHRWLVVTRKRKGQKK